RTHRPIHRAQLISRHVGAYVGVLDTGTDVPGEMGSQAIEQLDLRDRRRLRRSQRKDDHVGGVDGSRPPQQSAAGHHVDASPDRIAAPPLCCRADRLLTGTLLAGIWLTGTLLAGIWSFAGIEILELHSLDG